MLRLLEDFKLESQELRKMKDERNDEQTMMNRLIKNEVIDMADRMEIMQRMMQHQSMMILKLLNNQQKQMIEGSEGDMGEDEYTEVSRSNDETSQGQTT